MTFFNLSGSQNDFLVTFEFDAFYSGFIITKDGVDLLTTDYSYDSGTHILHINTAPSCLKLVIARETDVTTGKSTFISGNDLTDKNLNQMAKQLLYRLQEISAMGEDYAKIASLIDEAAALIDSTAVNAAICKTLKELTENLLEDTAVNTETCEALRDEAAALVIECEAARVAAEITSEDTIDTIDGLSGIEGLPQKVVTVRGYHIIGDGGEGTFIYDVTKLAVNNGGTILNGWIRQYIGAVKAEWFGAKGDNNPTSATINTLAIQAALDTNNPVELSVGTYYINPLMMAGNSFLSGRGKTLTVLKGVSSGAIINSANVEDTFSIVGLRIQDLSIDGNSISDAIDIGSTLTGNYITSEVFISNVKIFNTVNGVKLHKVIYSKLSDMSVLGVDGIGSYGISVDTGTGSTTFINVVTANYAYNWYINNSFISTVDCATYNDDTKINSVNLMLLENASKCSFTNMVFEHLPNTDIHEVELFSTTTSTQETALNVFNNCKWIGTNASGGTSTRIALGRTGGINNSIYGTEFIDCSFKLNLYGTDIRIINSQKEKIINCARFVGYSSASQLNPLIIPNQVMSRGEFEPFTKVTSSVATSPNTSHAGMEYKYYTISPNQIKGWQCVGKGTVAAPSYEATGNTDGSTSVITGLSNVSNVYVGDFVKVSGGFPSYIAPYQVIGKTATTLTLDMSSSSIQAVTVTLCAPAFKIEGSLKQTIGVAALSGLISLEEGNIIMVDDIDIATTITVGTTRLGVAVYAALGDEVTFIFTNGANVCMINWNGLYKTSYTSIESNKKAIVKFWFDGVNWIEVHSNEF